MCKFEHGIKLCICDKKQLQNMIKNNIPCSFWTLKRFESVNWMELEFGRCLHPTYSLMDTEIADFILYYLNTEHCFDFDFIPKPQDTLNFTLYSSQYLNQSFNQATNLTKLQPLKLEFEFRNSEWQQVASISEELNEHWVIYQGKVDTKNLEN